MSKIYIISQSHILAIFKEFYIGKTRKLKMIKQRLTYIIKLINDCFVIF